MKFKISDELKARLSSRKLWLSLIAAFVAFGNSMWNWGLSVQEVAQIVWPLLAFVGIEGLGDMAERFKK